MANSYDRVELYENSYSCDASAARLQLKSARWRTVPLMEVPSRYRVIAPRYSYKKDSRILKPAKTNNNIIRIKKFYTDWVQNFIQYKYLG